MGCYCDYSDGPDFWVDTQRIARKNHICCECLSPIEPGEKYHIFTGKWDGKINSYKYCEFCHDVYNVIQYHIDGCICLGSLWEVAVDYEPEIVKAGLLNATPAAG